MFNGRRRVVARDSPINECYMLVFIKSNYKIGDAIEITCTGCVVKGQIEYVNDRMIVVRQPNGQIYGIAGSDIHSFKAECPVPIVSVDYPSVHDQLEGTVDEPSAEAEGAEQAAENGHEEDNQVQEEHKLNFEPKVVGHIDLAQLQRIDPSLGRRKYFRKEDLRAEGENTENENGVEAPHSQAHSCLNEEAPEQHDQPYVPAKGRITFYHKEKKYGFIRDFSTEKDLYFYVQQVAEPSLYESLRKGLKVVYTSAKNAQGLVARCVHFPHTVKDLLFMVEDQLESKRYQLALDMVEHVLEVDAHNESANDLLLTIKEQMPAPKPKNEHGAAEKTEQYNPNVIYMQAKKAYLAKDFEQAEILYMQAIEANEKVESCVKDLVTLYVSNFKQNTDDEREQWRRKAIDFMEAHRHLLTDNLTTKQFLALNFFLPLLEYEKFLTIVEEILIDPQVAEVVSRRVFYLWQKAIALNKIGKSDDALAVIDEGLALAARNRQLLNLQHQILHPEEDAHQEAAAETVAEATAEASVSEAAVEETAAEVTGEAVEEMPHAAEEAEAADAETSPEEAPEEA